MKTKVYDLSNSEDRDNLSQYPEVRNLIGGKAAGLIDLIDMGFSVPKALVIPTTVCNEYFESDNKGEFMIDLVDDFIVPILKKWKKSNKGVLPLVSVRSGARVSMPGMMDTVLNVGISKQNSKALKKFMGADVFYETCTRLIYQYANVVHSISAEEWLESQSEIGVCGSDKWKKLANNYLEVYRHAQKDEFPVMAKMQILECVEAVFNSWNSDRAKHYREMHGYDDSWGTGVVIQRMVYGNLDADSCTGVMFTRDPETGSKGMMGEYLVKAQGEDVVSGTVTPLKIKTLKKVNKKLYKELDAVAHVAEQYFSEVQDMEFTVQKGKLYLLQTRDAKRSPKAAIAIATAMYDEGTHNLKQYKNKLNYSDYSALAVVELPKDFKNIPDGKGGIPASGGLVQGVAVFSSEAAQASKEPCILIRKETSPEDIAGMDASVGIITRIGGVTSHAAVVARAMAKSCIVGCLDLEFKESNPFNGGSVVTLNQVPIKEGSHILMDGATGRIWVDVKAELTEPEIPKEAFKLVKHALKGHKGAVNCTSLSEVKAVLKAGASPVFVYTRNNLGVTYKKIIKAMNGKWGALDLRGVPLGKRDKLTNPLEAIIGSTSNAKVVPFTKRIVLSDDDAHKLHKGKVSPIVSLDNLPNDNMPYSTIVIEAGSVDELVRMKNANHRVAVNNSIKGSNDIPLLMDALEIEQYEEGINLEDIIYNFIGGA